MDVEASPVAQELLALMDQKHHWAYPRLGQPGLERSQLLTHFQHEYAVYVRDFPVLLARALGQVPPLPEVRRALAENLYEEQTGGISKSGPHPALFLEMMVGLGYETRNFNPEELEHKLHPAAVRYRDFLLEHSVTGPWQAATALLTIFVEGSVNERKELRGEFVRPAGEQAILNHPLVKYYGCPPSAMKLSRTHSAVEGSHRVDAWKILLTHVGAPTIATQVVGVCAQALQLWHQYRNGVAERMGLVG